MFMLHLKQVMGHSKGALMCYGVLAMASREGLVTAMSFRDMAWTLSLLIS